MTTKSATKKETGQLLPLPGSQAKGTVFAILIAISFVHLFNDSIQSVIPAIFPILKESMSLSYTQIGWISFAINFTASIMQPVIGLFSDKRPTPAILPIGMGFTLTGMLLLAYAADYKAVLIAVIFVGLGSAAFHPEGSRVSIWRQDHAGDWHNPFSRLAAMQVNRWHRCSQAGFLSRWGNLAPSGSQVLRQPGL